MWLFQFIIDLAIPAISAFLASEKAPYDWLMKVQLLSSNFDVAGFQKICLIVNIVSTTFILCFRLSYYRSKGERYKKEIAGLYNVIKQFAQNNFVHISGNEDFNFDLRIFVPEISIWKKLKSLLPKQKRERWFVIRNIEPFARKDTTEHLRIRVEPDEQGLVGQAYAKASIVYDEKLQTTNSTDYSLDTSQLHRTSNLRWSICVPIINDRNNVIAVMAFDSTQSDLDIENNKDEIRTLTNTLAIMMRDSVPELFKGKWSIK